MVDVDRRSNGQHAHVAGLKRLSARASKGPLGVTTSPRAGCFSFAPLARTVIDRLRRSSCQGAVQVTAGLSEEEFVRIEAPLAFSFPPDLKAILQEGLPVGAGFPDWRSGGLKQLRLALSLPIAGICFQVSRGKFWSKQHWGTRPPDNEQALAIARASLRKVPILIPIYRHFYISASPTLAGNPIFFVSHSEVFCYSYDLASFFEEEKFMSPDLALLLDADLGEKGQSFRIERPLEAPRRSGENTSHWSDREPEESAPLAGTETSHSFRLEKQLDHYKRSGGIGRSWESCSHVEGEGATGPEIDERNGKERPTDLECWGRNLDAMAKKAAAEPIPRRSAEFGEIRRKAKRLDHSIDFSNENRLPTSKASPLVKVARRIEFWSDLAEKQQHKYDHASPGHSFSFPKADDMDAGKDESEEGNGSKLVSVTPYWLDRYLDEMAAILRQGGWKESDVIDMFTVTSPMLAEPYLSVDSQTMMEGLVLYVNLLSDALRRAGWSTGDVAEAFDVDLSFRERKRRPSVPPHLAARIGKLAQYAANF